MPNLDDEPEPSSSGARSNPGAIKYITPPAGLPAAQSNPGVPQYITPPAGLPAAADSPFAAPIGASPFAAPPGPTPFALGPQSQPAAVPYVTPASGMPALGAQPGFSSPGMPAQSNLFARSQSQPIADQSFGMMGFAQQPGYAAPATTPDTRRKQTILIGIGAIVALAAGFALVLVLAGGKDNKKTKPTAGSGSANVVANGSNTNSAGSDAATPQVGSDGSGATEDGSGSAEPAVVVDTPTDAGTQKPDDPKPATDGPCKVSITSVPQGADVYQGDKKLGATPLTTELPCGVEAKLNLRKPRFINTGRAFTPAEGKANKLVVKLAKPTYTVKVTSSPAGATITVGGRSMGVTPATIRLPANEAAAIMVSKSGFKTDSKTVTPKSNNISHHVVLKKGR
jgi:hypothetical protein